jgi:hypothetical protein
MITGEFSKADLARTLEFQARLQEDNERYFGSDLFRAYNLHKHFDRPDKEIGLYFAKLKINGFVVVVGEVPSEVESNHRRKNDLLMWSEKGKNIRKYILDV